MLPKIAWVVLAALLIIAGSACGGGGGGSSTTTTTATTSATNTTTTGTIFGVHISATLASNSSQGIDPANVTVGEQLQLQVTAVNSSGQTVTYAGSNWQTSAPASVATVSSSGVLTGVGVSGSTNYSITCQGPLGALSTPLIVVPASQPLVTGLVRDKNGLGINQVKILFYNSAGTEVAESMTGSTGTFVASVPSSATQFSVDISVADPIISGTSIFYRQFEYSPSGTTFVYLEDDTACLTPLVSLSTSSNALASDIVLDDRASGPPPPPSGCAQG